MSGSGSAAGGSAPAGGAAPSIIGVAAIATLLIGGIVVAVNLGLGRNGNAAATGAAGTAAATSVPTGGSGGSAGGGGHTSCVPVAPATTPCGPRVAFYVPTYQTEDDRHALTVVRQLLAADGYPDATVFDNSLMGTNADLPGLADLANFQTLKDYDIVVIATHGAPQGLSVEYYCTEVAARTRMNYLVTTGIPASEMRVGPVESFNTTCPTQFPTPAPSSGDTPWASGAMWAVAFSAALIQQWFDGARTSVLYADSCSALPIFSSLGIAAVYAYPVASIGGRSGQFGCGPGCACGESGTALNDLQTLFRSLVGEDGVENTNTQQAYDLHGGKWSANMTYFPASGAAPVVLAPAVVKTDPGDGGSLMPGVSNFVTFTFDASMSQTQPVTLEGNDCGASIRKQEWKGQSNVLWVTLDVPVQSKPSTLRLRVHADQAISAGPGWTNPLSGNEGDKQFNGEDPNNNDYVVHLQCGSGLDLTVNGTVGGQPVSGQIVGNPAPTLECEPVTSGNDVVGSVVRWNGESATTHTALGGEWSQRYGTWPVGDAVGAAPVSIDIGSPLAHLGGLSGTITITASGGSIDATTSSGGDSIQIKGTWTCPAAPTPS